ncbi:MAG: protein kinase [Myxococcales bacterium]|nr:protein kinase [Myxococcales bacterium]
MSSQSVPSTQSEPLLPTLPRSGEAPARSSRVRVGELLSDRYLLKRFIAAGGMGEVWEAEDSLLHETVALKLLKSDDGAPEAIARLKSEVTLARKVSHRNVCRVHEFGAHRPVGQAPLFFFTMELLQGVTLSELLRERGALPEEEVLEIVVQLAAGLDAAHRAGVIHRDFKSSNVFLEPGAQARVVITDFGVALAIQPGPRISVEGQGLLGTPAYMAPEQASGHDAGPASDLYALGVVTFELLTGRLPFDGSSLVAQLKARLTSAPLDVTLFRPDLPARWSEGLRLILARRSEDRLQSGEAFVNALRDGSFSHRPGLRVRVRAGIASVAIACLTVAGFWWVAGPERRGWADIPTDSAATPQSAQALRRAMVAYSAFQGGRDRARQVVAEDPEFAEARLQLLYLARFANSNRPVDAVELLHEVQLRRAQLTTRDRELLDAIEPALLDPPQHEETLARLERLAEKRPRDAQVWNAIALEHLAARRTEKAIVAFRAERQADPGSLAGVANEASAAYERGEQAEAQRLLARCLATNAGHAPCLMAAGNIAAADGSCRELDDLGRSLFAATPGSRGKALLSFRYSSLLRQHADQAALDGLRVLMLQQLDEVWHRAIDEADAVARHDLGAQLARALQASPADDDIAPTVDATTKARLLLEVGRDAEALELVSAALAATAAAPSPARPHLDATPRLWMLQRQHGVLSPEAHATKRDAWVSTWRKRLGARSEVQDALLWVIAWAPFEAGTAELGVEAMQTWGNRPLPRASLALASVMHGLPFLTDLGHLAMVGARLEDAEGILTQANALCTWNLIEPRVGLMLAQVQARRGLRNKACETLRAYFAEWNDLRPRSVSLERARELADGLSCPSS